MSHAEVFGRVARRVANVSGEKYHEAARASSASAVSCRENGILNRAASGRPAIMWRMSHGEHQPSCARAKGLAASHVAAARRLSSACIGFEEMPGARRAVGGAGTLLKSSLVRFAGEIV